MIGIKMLTFNCLIWWKSWGVEREDLCAEHKFQSFTLHHLLQIERSKFCKKFHQLRLKSSSCANSAKDNAQTEKMPLFFGIVQENEWLYKSALTICMYIFSNISKRHTDIVSYISSLSEENWLIKKKCKYF